MKYPTIRLCELYNSEFEIQKSTKRKFCSIECRLKHLSLIKTKPIITEIKQCEKCGENHDGTFGSGRFCSSVCARSFATFGKRKEIKQKISETWGKKKIYTTEKTCPECKNSFTSLIRFKQIYCSSHCANKAQVKKIKSQEFRDHMRKIQIQKVENNTHSGWQSRLGKPPSYPEIFFMRVFKNNSILYTRELHVGKYFIDFALEDKKIAIEIDGKQHNYPDRKIKDAEKDLFLTTSGWKVYRIKWKAINTDDGKQYIKTEIDKMMGFINVN